MIGLVSMVPLLSSKENRSRKTLKIAECSRRIKPENGAELYCSNFHKRAIRCLGNRHESAEQGYLITVTRQQQVLLNAIELIGITLLSHIRLPWGG